MSSSRLASLNLNLLVALDALLSERSVTAAGRKIGLAQSSMSHALASLREAFDDPLLVRSADGMVPTPRARELESPLRAALEGLEAAIEAPKPFDPAAASATFAIASDSIQQVVLLPRVLSVLQARAPGVVVHSEAPAGAAETVRRLRSGELDFAIGHFDGAPASIHRKVLATDRVVYIARKGHPRIRRTLTKAAASRERQLAQTPITAGEMPGTARSAQPGRERAPTVLASTPHLLAALFIVAQTDLITGTVERVAEMYKDALGLSVFPAPVKLPRIDTHIIWHERVDRSPAHQWLLGLLLEAGRARAGRSRQLD